MSWSNRLETVTYRSRPTPFSVAARLCSAASLKLLHSDFLQDRWPSRATIINAAQGLSNPPSLVYFNVLAHWMCHDDALYKFTYLLTYFPCALHSSNMPAQSKITHARALDNTILDTLPQSFPSGCAMGHMTRSSEASALACLISTPQW